MMVKLRALTAFGKNGDWLGRTRCLSPFSPDAVTVLMLIAIFTALAGSAVLAWPKPEPATGAPPSGSVQLGINVSLGGKRIFPEDNPWNQDISKAAVDPHSRRYIETIGATLPLHPDFGTVYQRAPAGIPYVVVAGDQPRVPVHFSYADESDRGLYPVPPDAPIEGGPNARDGDRHVLIIDRDNWKLYELFAAHREGEAWHAGSGAVFDLGSNKLRPAGWTSADAAGLPIFPGLVRYDEVVEQKEIRHALRFTVKRSRKAYAYPARHYASKSTDPALPPMGMRVRLRAAYDISKFPPNVQVILRALKRYGMFLADNGGDWYISGAPDPRWNDEELGALKRVKAKDLEVVKLDKIVTR